MKDGMKFPLLPRKKNTDKKDYGHVLVVAGSDQMTGAAILTTSAVLRSGAGLVTTACTKPVKQILIKKIPEAMAIELFSAKAFLSKKIDAIAIGPGLTVKPKVAKLVRHLVSRAQTPVVLDADGLNSFKGRLQDLKKHSTPLVLTPHEREFERLFAVKWPTALAARIKLAKNLCRIYDVTLVLKSHQTLVVDKDRHYVNRTGNPGMATAGTGDVLTGIISSFIAQRLNPFEAAKWAVYFHGKAGDLAARKKGQLGLVASDLLEFLPLAFRWSSSAGRATVL